MYPPAVDNYGIDCCSIMCIQTTPPIVVIADCSGKIYHAILLADDFEDEEKKVCLSLLFIKLFSNFNLNYLISIN